MTHLLVGDVLYHVAAEPAQYVRRICDPAGVLLEKGFVELVVSYVDVKQRGEDDGVQIIVGCDDEFGELGLRTLDI